MSKSESSNTLCGYVGVFTSATSWDFCLEYLNTRPGNELFSSQQCGYVSYSHVLLVCLATKSKSCYWWVVSSVVFTQERVIKAKGKGWKRKQLDNTGLSKQRVSDSTGALVKMAVYYISQMFNRFTKKFEDWSQNLGYTSTWDTSQV